ncbi:MAG: hypothetical protein WCW36_02995 [Candidatus Paceibacterota bacterium]|jgi:hypothetical protein
MEKPKSEELVQEIELVWIFSKSFPGKSWLSRLHGLFTAAFQKYSPETPAGEIHALVRIFAFGYKSIGNLVTEPVRKYLVDMRAVQTERNEQEEFHLRRVLKG